MSRADRLARAAALALALAACQQPLMQDQPHREPLEASALFADGTSARPLPEGTIARGQLRADDHLYRGRVAGALVTTFPWRLTVADLRRGRERFEIFCTPCHGRLGDGNGIVVQRGFKQPPSYHDPILRDAPVGHLFEVISHGFDVMPDYAMQVPVADRWRIVGYIRALQLSQRAPLDDVPPVERRRLEESNR